MTADGPDDARVAATRKAMERVLDLHPRLADGWCGCGEPMCGAREPALAHLVRLEFGFGLGVSADDEE